MSDKKQKHEKPLEELTTEELDNLYKVLVRSNSEYADSMPILRRIEKIVYDRVVK